MYAEIGQGEGLVFHPAVGIGHDGHQIDPEQDGTAVPVEGLSNLIEYFEGGVISHNH